jgi:hypothetical protein
MRRNPFAALEKAVAQDNPEAVQVALIALSDHEKDLLVDCPVSRCRSSERQECAGMEEGRVHIGRRIKRILEGIR